MITKYSVNLSEKRKLYFLPWKMKNAFSFTTLSQNDLRTLFHSLHDWVRVTSGQNT